MKFSELIPLGGGVFQLEEGYGKWIPKLCEAVVIQFAGSEIELTAKRFEDFEEVFLPSSLEDRHLRTIEVHCDGWYLDTTTQQIEELASSIFEFLEKMRIGQKVIISDAQGHECQAKIYVVKLINVHAEVPTKLSSPEQALFDTVRELKPRTEDDWAKIAAKVDAKWPRDDWQKIMKRFEIVQQSETIPGQHFETPNLLIGQTAASNLESGLNISSSIKPIDSDTRDGEAKKEFEPKDIIQGHDLSTKGTLNGYAPTYPIRYKDQEVTSKENSKGGRKRWSNFYW